jgi:hypothetical protein
MLKLLRHQLKLTKLIWLIVIYVIKQEFLPYLSWSLKMGIHANIDYESIPLAIMCFDCIEGVSMNAALEASKISYLAFRDLCDGQRPAAMCLKCQGKGVVPIPYSEMLDIQ